MQHPRLSRPPRHLRSHPLSNPCPPLILRIHALTISISKLLRRRKRKCEKQKNEKKRCQRKRPKKALIPKTQRSCLHLNPPSQIQTQAVLHSRIKLDRRNPPSPPSQIPCQSQATIHSQVGLDRILFPRM